MVFKNPSKDLKGPSERKTFIDSLCLSADGRISEFCRSKGEAKLVVSNKHIASQIVDYSKCSELSLEASVKEAVFVAAVKQAPDDLDYSKV